MKARVSGTTLFLPITDKSFLEKEEIEQMITDADDRYHNDDLEQQKYTTARNDLELYCYNVKSSMKKVNHSFKETILEEIDHTIQWLENDPLVSVEEMESKKKNIEQWLIRVPSSDYKPVIPILGAGQKKTSYYSNPPLQQYNHLSTKIVTNTIFQ